MYKVLILKYFELYQVLQLNSFLLFEDTSLKFFKNVIIVDLAILEVLPRHKYPFTRGPPVSAMAIVSPVFVVEYLLTGVIPLNKVELSKTYYT